MHGPSMSTDPQSPRAAEAWSRLEAALDRLLGLPAERQAAALSRIAQREPALAGELRSLLAQVGGEDALLDRPALALRAEADIDAAQPQADAPLSAGTSAALCVGPYRLLKRIGCGGMSEVFCAERGDGAFAQRVALKRLNRDDHGARERFRSECAALARLEHPGIARLIDAGLADDGRPYLVMELVDGAPITEWCRQHRSDLDERLRLFAEVCAAVAHAHRQRVIHRDLKPANVLVCADGRVRLLDFGVAKLLDRMDAPITRNIPLTPGYAAPEQITGGAISAATDVHALGLLLHELLTGAPARQLAELPLLTALDKVLRDAPPLASRHAAAQPRPPIRAGQLRGDLDAIIAKALRRAPEHRYDSVTALAQDLARSRRRQPVRAREGARLYALGRFLSRFRLPLASAVIAASALLGSLFAIAVETRLAHEQAAQAEAARDLLMRIGAATPARLDQDRITHVRITPLLLPADDDEAVLAATTARSTRPWLLVPP